MSKCEQLHKNHANKKNAPMTPDVFFTDTVWKNVFNFPLNEFSDGLTLLLRMTADYMVVPQKTNRKTKIPLGLQSRPYRSWRAEPLLRALCFEGATQGPRPADHFSGRSRICQRGGRTMASAERDPITGVRGLSLQRGSRGSVPGGGQTESFLSIFLQKRGQKLRI